MVDVRRVEVLRGPQGTLFGRNTTGGAVNIIANQPSTDGFDAMARFDYGNYDTFLARGMINVPMGDALAARVAYQHREHGSYGSNMSLDRGLGDANSAFVRVSFKLEPTGSRFQDFLSAGFTTFSNSEALVGHSWVTLGDRGSGAEERR